MRPILVFRSNNLKGETPKPRSSELGAQGCQGPKKQQGRKAVKKTILSIALALVAPFAWGQTTSTTTTTTTTTGSGTITEYTPGSVIALKETSGPRRYKFGKTVTYVTKSGKTLDEAAVKTRIKLGIPVSVHYTGEGENMLVDRVIVDDDED